MQSLVVGAYQCTSPAGDLAKGLDRVERALSVAKERGVDLLTMPELLLPGYVAATRGPPEGWQAALARLQELVGAHQTALVIGLPEYAGDAWYNTAVAFGPDGKVLARYRKIQLYGELERDAFCPGERYVTFDYRGHRLGLLVCYDVEFPEHVRALARQGCEAILVPTANMQPFDCVNRLLVPARAIENAITIAYANYSGSEAHLTFTGQSLVARGDDRVRRIETGEGLVSLATVAEGELPLATQLEDWRKIES